MNSTAIKNELLKVLPTVREAGLVSPSDIVLTACSALLRTPCEAVFFAVVEEATDMTSCWQRAEGEVADLVRQGGKDAWPRDRHLVLIVPAEVSVDLPEIQRIKSDQHVCRKLFCFVNGQPLSELFENLPFWPAKMLEVPSAFVAGYDILQLLQAEGFDPDLINDIYRGQPGVDRISRRILAGTYALSRSTSFDSSMTRKGFPRNSQRGLSQPSRGTCELSLNNFRGIVALTLDLSADIVFLYGANGSGKTSIIEAIEWCVTGRIDRLLQPWPDDSPTLADPVVNVLGDGESATVKLSLAMAGNTLHLSRRGGLETTTAERGGKIAKDDRQVIDFVVGTSAPARERKLRLEELRSLFRSTHFLGQSTMRQFLEHTNPELRFDSLSKMVGAEAFVFFREKLERISNRLSKYLDARRYEETESVRMLQEAQARLASEEKALADTLEALKETASTTERAAEIRERMAGLGLSISQDQIALIGSSLSGGELEAVIILGKEILDSSVSQAKDRLDKLVAMKERVRRRPEVEYKANQDRQAIDVRGSEVEQLTLEQNRIESEINENETALAAKEALLSDFQRDSDAQQWLLFSLPKWRSLESKQTSIVQRMTPLRAAFEEVQKTLDSLRVELRRLHSDNQQLKLERLEKGSQSHKIANLLSQFPDLENNLIRLSTQNERLHSLNKEINKCRVAVDGLEAQQYRTAEKLGETVQQIETRERLRSRRVNLLDDLRNLVESPRCPVCGHEHDSVGELLISIDVQLGFSDPELDDLKSRRKTMEEELETLRSQIATDSLRLNGLSQEISDLQQELGRIELHRERFKNDVTNAGFVWNEDLNELKAEFADADRAVSLSGIEPQEAHNEEQIRILESRVLSVQNDLEASEAELNTSQAELELIQREMRRMERESVDRGLPLQTAMPEEEIRNKVSALLIAIETANNERLSVESTIRDCVENRQRIIVSRTALEEQRDSLVSRVRQAEADKEWLIAELTSLALPAELNQSELDAEVAAIELRLAALARALSDLESSKVLVDLQGLRSRLVASKQELDLSKADLQAKRKLVRELDDWRRHLNQLNLAVQRQHADQVKQRLDKLSPAVNLLYNRLSTHPFFTSVDVRVSDSPGSVRFGLRADDAVASRSEALKIAEFSPGKFFSEAQINVLALSIFLAGATQQRWSNLRTICIDDPVQQMDDMNAYAFLELIRGLSRKRQFIITTCDPRLYELAMEMFDCLNKNGKQGFRAYRLQYDGEMSHKLIQDTPQ